jgi:hypothetical protein
MDRVKVDVENAFLHGWEGMQSYSIIEITSLGLHCVLYAEKTSGVAY